MTDITSGSSSGASADAGERRVADFWFDPRCPWAWITSRWMLEVEQVRPVTTRWNVMSLAILNDQPKEEVASWGPVRIATAAAVAAERGDFGDDDASAVLGRYYTELGTRLHVDKAPNQRETWQAALAAAGLPAELVEAAESEAYDDQLAKSHGAAMELVGTDVGTPVISVDGNAFFGPVVTPIPRGEAAGKLWDGVLLVSETDGFYELKRSRTRPPITS